MADCVRCDRRDAGVAYACVPCARALQRELGRLADLVSDLDVTIARQGRSGDRGGRRDDDPLPVNLAAVGDAWAVTNTVTTWIRDIARSRGVRAVRYPRITGPTCRTNAGVPGCGHRSCLAVSRSGQPVDELPEAIRWLAAQTEWIRHQPDAEMAIDELADACALAVRIVDRRSPRWYAGPCNELVRITEDGTRLPDESGRACGIDLYAHAGATTVRCPACHASYDASARRDWLLSAARDTLVHAELLARAVAALGVCGASGRPISPSAVRNLAARGRIVGRGADRLGRALYRVGEVLDVLGEQRTGVERVTACAVSA